MGDILPRIYTIKYVKISFCDGSCLLRCGFFSTLSSSPIAFVKCLHVGCAKTRKRSRLPSSRSRYRNGTLVVSTFDTWRLYFYYWSLKLRNCQYPLGRPRGGSFFEHALCCRIPGVKVPVNPPLSSFHEKKIRRKENYLSEFLIVIISWHWLLFTQENWGPWATFCRFLFQKKNPV